MTAELVGPSPAVQSDGVHWKKRDGQLSSIFTEDGAGGCKLELPSGVPVTTKGLVPGRGWELAPLPATLWGPAQALWAL